MAILSSPLPPARRSTLAAATALVLALTASAVCAQPYGAYGGSPDDVQAGTSEHVEIYGRRPPPERSAIGAPIEEVSLSRAVPYDDLDLRTDWGVRELHERIRATAHRLCRRLDFLYPISTSDSPPCYRTAVEDAMYQADRAIWRARRD